MFDNASVEWHLQSQPVSPLSPGHLCLSTKQRGACARHSLVLDHSLSSSRLPRSSVWSQVLCRQDPHESAGNLVQYRKRASGKMRATFRLRHTLCLHGRTTVIAPEQVHASADAPGPTYSILSKFTKMTSLPFASDSPFGRGSCTVEFSKYYYLFT